MRRVSGTWNNGDRICRFLKHGNTPIGVRSYMEIKWAGEEMMNSRSSDPARGAGSSLSEGSYGLPITFGYDNRDLRVSLYIMVTRSRSILLNTPFSVKPTPVPATG